MRRLLLCALALGCRPELPGRACAETADCFKDEVCVQRTCVAADEAPNVGSTADARVDDGGPDVVPDAAPSERDGAPADAAPRDADSQADAASGDATG